MSATVMMTLTANGMPKASKGLKKPPMVPYGLAIAAGTLYAVFLG